jgi:hypothetical protein
MVMDTHRVVKRLKEAGFTDTQAEVVTDIVRDAREAELGLLVTKSDLAEFKVAAKADFDGFKVATKADFADFKTAIHADMASLRAEFKSELGNFKVDLFKWLVPLLLGQVALTATLVKLL